MGKRAREGRCERGPAVGVPEGGKQPRQRGAARCASRGRDRQPPAHREVRGKGRRPARPAAGQGSRSRSRSRGMAARRDLLLSPPGSVCRGPRWGRARHPPHRDPAGPQVRAGTRCPPCPPVSRRVPPSGGAVISPPRPRVCGPRGGVGAGAGSDRALPESRGAPRAKRQRHRAPSEPGRPGESRSVRVKRNAWASGGCSTGDLGFCGRCCSAPCVSADGHLSGFMQTHGSARILVARIRF